MRGLDKNRAILLALGIALILAALALLVMAFAPVVLRRETFPLLG